MSGTAGFTGRRINGSADTDFNSIDFMIKQQIGKLQTATVVKVVAVTNSGGLAAVGFVDVVPQVDMVDVEGGQATPHGTIHGLPYVRIQGGANAVIIDPAVGDLGIAIFASRDISSVKRVKKRAPPGSDRRHSYSDGMYIGGLLNGAPSQFVRFGSDGVSITSPVALTVTAPEIVLNGNVTSNGKNIGSTHTHSGVQAGGANTGGPNT